MSGDDLFGPGVVEETLDPAQGEAGETEAVLVYRESRPEPDRIQLMIDRLRGDPGVDAVVTGEAVTDAVKVVDDQGHVTDSLDRSQLLYPGLPAVVRRTAWEASQIDRVLVV